MTKIKICGITNYKDAQNAIDLGADFLGFNFYSKSPRYVNKYLAKFLINEIDKKILKVGVFVNEDINKINEIVNSCNLDLIQLSGNESIQYLNTLKKSTNKKIINAIRIKNGLNIKKLNAFDSDYIMLDSFKEGFYGGTGESFDLNLIKNVNNKKLFLAGGLNDINVNEAIKKLNPFAVDVCSSIESSPGKKDFNKMKKFIEAVK
ncbi:MAG TPA: phosphoribosylanthranilate isomerase [Candidatus Nanoarchaeia archaeon]|nr:phosphoribosylanthranilate isomerase [Candidatus Nanoarchaeia archaeon]